MCTRLAFTTILVQHASFVQTITCIYNFYIIEVCDSLYSAICAMKYTDSGITSIKAYFVLEATDGYTTETILSGVITISVHSFHPMPIYSSLSSLLPTLIHKMHTCVRTHTNLYTHLPPGPLHLHHLADHMPCLVSPGPLQLAPACPPFHLGYPTQ